MFDMDKREKKGNRHNCSKIRPSGITIPENGEYGCQWLSDITVSSKRSYFKDFYFVKYSGCNFGYSSQIASSSTAMSLVSTLVNMHETAVK